MPRKWNCCIHTCCSISLLLLLSACATQPKIIAQSEIENRAASDLEAMFASQPVQGAIISLPEAIARSIKFNLDNRVKLMEAALAHQQLDLSNYSKLPRLAANAGYTVRSNRQASNSLNLSTGVESFGASTSQDKSIVDASLQLSWNTLDFGIALINTRQAADELMIAVERQRKMTHSIIKDVRFAYWRMASAERLQHDLVALLRDIRAGLNKSYQAQQAKLKPLEECLEEQRAMLDLQRQMLILQRDIAEAQIELTALMGLAPGTEFKLLTDTSFPTPYSVEKMPTLTDLERMALRNRPELLEEDYKKRIALKEIKKSRLKMIPGFELFTGYHLNNNSYLVHNNWASSGIKLTWNLLNLISGPAAIRAAKSAVELADLRRMALSMAILTQVDIAKFRLEQSEEDYGIAAEIHRVDNDMFRQYESRLKSSLTDPLTVLRAKARKLVSDFRHSMAYADWQNSVAQLYSSVGYEPAVVLDYDATLEELTDAVRLFLEAPAFSLEEGYYSSEEARDDKNTADQYRTVDKELNAYSILESK